MWTKSTKGQLKHSEGKLVTITTPDVVALARTVDASLSASSEITLNIQTTMLRVYAITKDVYLRWGADNASATTFDEVIPAAQVFDFKVPNGQTAVNFIEREASATVIVIEK